MKEKTSQITRLKLNNKHLFALGYALVLIIVLCLGGCSPKHYSYSEFKNIPSTGWYKECPLKFVPQFGDSLGLYNLKIAFSFDNDFKYTNMCIMVDLIKDNKLMDRRIVKSNLGDSYGNWRKPGFGATYQCEEFVVDDIKPSQVDKIIFWQGMNVDTLKDVSRVGIILEPVSQL